MDLSDEDLNQLKKGGFIIDQYPDGGIVEYNGYKYKQDQSGNWTFANSGAPVTDKLMIQKITYEGKPVGSSAVQVAPKPKPISTVTKQQQLETIKNSPVIADQRKANQLQDEIRNENIYFPKGEPAEDDANYIEGLVNSALDYPMSKAALSAEFATNEGQVDNYRHANAGRYTAEAIKDMTGNIPYLSDAAAIVGANALGLGHEIGAWFANNYDTRPWTSRLKESGEDMYNNFVGTTVGVSDMTPVEKTDKLLNLSYSNQLPDGYVKEPGAPKNVPNNMYFKHGPNDPGKYKPRYPDGGQTKPRKVRKEVKPFTTSNLKEYTKRKQAYDDSLTLYNAGLKEYDLLKKTKGVAAYDPLYDKEAYDAYKRLGYPKGYNVNVKRSDNTNTRSVMYEKPVQPVNKKSKPVPKKSKPNTKKTNFDKELPPLEMHGDYNEFLKRQAAYDDSLALYNSYNEFTNALKNPKYSNKNSFNKLSNLQGKNQGWGPQALPGNPYQNINPVKELTYYQGSQPWRVYKYKKPKQPVNYKMVDEPTVKPIIPTEQPQPPVQDNYPPPPAGGFPPGPPPPPSFNGVEPFIQGDPIPEYATPDRDAQWVAQKERYIDWDGNSIGFNGVRFRKPGHGGDLIKKGRRHYLHYPSIETRNSADIIPEEEEFAEGGMVKYPDGGQPRPVQGMAKPLAPLAIRQEQVKALKNSPKVADQKKYKAVQDEVKAKATIQKASQQLDELQKDALPQYEQPLTPQDWIWTLPMAGGSAMKSAGTAIADGVGALGTKAMPYITGALETSLPFMKSIPGATVGNAIASGFATDAIVNRLPEGVTQLNNGQYIDATGNILTGLLDVAGAGMMSPLYQGAKSTASELARFLGTEEGLLSNTYKVNPWALKENPEMMLYRARPVGQDINMNMAAQLRAKEAAGEPLKWYQKQLLNPQTNPEILAREKYYGQWFEKDPSRLDFYINPETRNFVDEDAIEILRTKLPRSEANKLNVSQFDDAKLLSASPKTEFILPKDMISSAEAFPESSWQQLIQEDKVFNTPHWLKGYKGVPKELPGSPNTSFLKDLPYSEIPQINPQTGLLQVNNTTALSTILPRTFKETYIPGYKSAEGLSEDMLPYLLPQEELMTRAPWRYLSKDQEIMNSFKSGARAQERPVEIPKEFNTQEDIMARALGKPLPERVSRASLEPKIYYDIDGNVIDDPLKSGFDGNFLTRPLTPFTKNELTTLPNKNLKYRKIGNKAGLQDLINKGGAQAPAPMRMKSGLTADTPFFGMGKKPSEDYKGIFAVELKPDNSKYNWSSRVAGTDNYGVAPFDKVTGRSIKNVPLEDLNVYRKKFLSNNYKKLDPNNLEEGLKYAQAQVLAEQAYKWGIRGVTADQIFNDGDYRKQLQNAISNKLENNKKEGGSLNYMVKELTPEEIEEYRRGGYIVEDY